MLIYDIWQVFDDDYSVVEEYWAKKLGHAIGNSRYLRKLYANHTYRPTTFFTGLANNRSIEHLKLGDFCFERFDAAPFIAHFMKHNYNLRSIELPCKGLIGNRHFLSALMESNLGRLERIDLVGFRQLDDGATDLINALTMMPGLSKLLELWLRGNKIGVEGCNAMGQLLTSSACKIKYLNLFGNDLDDKCIEILTGALTKNSSVKVLELTYQLRVTPKGWCTFLAYLSNPMCSLETIDLSCNKLGDEGAIALGKFITVDKIFKLKNILLCEVSDDTTSAGWHGFASSLRSPKLAIAKLDISCSSIDGNAAIAIISALSKASTLKSLNMAENAYIESTGWIGCFQVMKDCEFVLEELIVNGNNINDEGAAILFESITMNGSLKTLNIAQNRSITSAGWIACFRLLLDAGCNLATLHLCENNIDDEGATVLVELLANISTLYFLALEIIHSVTIDGWRTFAKALLPASTSKLRELKLGAVRRVEDTSDIVDDFVLRFAESLAHNTSLEVLELCDYYKVSITGWKALAKAFCDNSSIDKICSSNHTLHTMEDYEAIKIGACSEELPHFLISLLNLNRNKNKAEVIRAKILKYFFSNGATVGPAFADAATTIMPLAIGWIGSDCLGLSAMYHLVQSMPWLIKVKAVPGSNGSAAVEPPRKTRKVK